MIESCRRRGSACPGRGDQRFFWLEWFAVAAPNTVEQITVDETDAPPDLVALWEHGIAGLD